ncbi:MAG: ribulose-phosphate 3-epimerase [Chitinophagia bacterium]|jgi:ribulose-phosphate 3-epimerase|nr:ribulose-phosphate 3-epimerase [Chitinophagia bacterium]
MPIIAPSLLSANFLQLDKACEMLNNSEAEWFHLDVMDGRFVPNISFGIPVVSAIRKATKKICDVHLMIEEPQNFAEAFQQAGADILTVHVEACTHLHRNLQQIKSLGMKAGIAINPHTPLDAIKEVIAEADLVCIMSVNPGFGGQKFIASTLSKIEKLKNIITQSNAKTLIEVDGGVTLENANAIVKAGADVLVAGNTVFNSSDPAGAIKLLKNIH